jgi:hypothetical protein
MSTDTSAPIVETPTPTTETPATPATPATTPAPAATPAPATTETPAATPTPTPTVITAPEPAADVKPVETKWPSDWREQLAAGDDKRLKQLQRYSDYTAFANKAFSLEAKLSSGEYRRPLPKDATPEQVAEWRKENGLPEKAEDYKIELPNGVVLGESDKETVAELQKFGFEKNLPPSTLNELTSWYYSRQDQLSKAQEVSDQNYHEESKDSLMAEWGLKDYRQNISAMASVRDQMPQGLADRILAGRTADGKLIGDDPTFLKWFASVSRELNPHASVVGLDAGRTVDGELETIRKLRREDPTKYDQDKAMQARELELITAQLKSKARQG